MHSQLLLGALMAVGAAAVPAANPAVHVVDIMKTVTVTLEPGQSAPTPAPVAAPAPQAPGAGFLQHGSKSAPSSGGSEQEQWAALVSQYRAEYSKIKGLKTPLGPVTYNSDMLANCEEVGQAGGGVQQIHKLIPHKQMGQIITPTCKGNVKGHSDISCFEMALMNWFCEVPSSVPTIGSSSPCGLVSDVMHMQYSDAGHQEILVDPKYTQIACAFTGSGHGFPYMGVMVCDLA